MLLSGGSAFIGLGALGTPWLPCLAAEGFSVFFCSFIFLTSFAFYGLRNPTEYLCSPFKDFVPSSMNWKTSYGQILSFHGALLNSAVAVDWGENYYLTHAVKGGQHNSRDREERERNKLNHRDESLKVIGKQGLNLDLCMWILAKTYSTGSSWR